MEKVTVLSDERAVTSLLFEPLGMSHSFFTPGDVVIRRFAMGHLGVGSPFRSKPGTGWRF